MTEDDLENEIAQLEWQLEDAEVERDELKAEVERLKVYLDHAVRWCEPERPDWLTEYKEWKSQTGGGEDE